MSKTLLGRKIGMSRYFLEDGTNIPVTVVEAGPCVVTQVKTEDTDGYNAVQIGFEDVRPGRATMPIIGHDAKAGTAPKRFHREVRLEEETELEPGQSLDVSVFEEVMFVDVVGTSKGKGFQGGMKRHNFKGLEASHGVKRRHRSPGSINGHATNLGTGPKLKKGLGSFHFIRLIFSPYIFNNIFIFDTGKSCFLPPMGNCTTGLY